jgi:phosphate transport system permease protein
MTKSISTAQRYASERRFKALGLAAILITAAFLAFLLTDIVSKAIPAFTTNAVPRRHLQG